MSPVDRRRLLVVVSAVLLSGSSSATLTAEGLGRGSIDALNNGTHVTYFPTDTLPNWLIFSQSGADTVMGVTSGSAAVYVHPYQEGYYGAYFIPRWRIWSDTNPAGIASVVMTFSVYDNLQLDLFIHYLSGNNSSPSGFEAQAQFNVPTVPCFVDWQTLANQFAHFTPINTNGWTLASTVAMGAYTPVWVPSGTKWYADTSIPTANFWAFSRAWGGAAPNVQANASAIAEEKWSLQSVTPSYR